jgi:hypothetical protein
MEALRRKRAFRRDFAAAMVALALIALVKVGLLSLAGL